MFSSEKYDAAVVGGGFYGCYLASSLAAQGLRVTLLEAETELMTRASYRNQARVHGGYHYPRNFTTARRARALLPAFIAEFGSAIESDFAAIYAVSRQQSKVTAPMFQEFMKAIDARLEVAGANVHALFAKGMIENCFQVVEPVFDAAKLRAMMKLRLESLGVDVRLNCAVRKVHATPQGVTVVAANGNLEVENIYLCTYSDMNSILRASGLESVDLQHQWSEICLIELPPELAGLGVTVVDGPFFSTLPFPDRACHSLTHVNYTHHAAWEDDGQRAPVLQPLARKSAFNKMIKDAARWMPAMAAAKYVDSLWEVKTTLPKNSENAGRPILWLENYQIKGLNLILGGKIDTALEVAAHCVPNQARAL